MSILRKARFLAEHRGLLKRVLTLNIDQNDASLYFFIYGNKALYHYGTRTLKSGEINNTFNFKDQNFSKEPPKLSIHQSGQVHVYDREKAIAGPLNTIPLPDWRGQHIATVTVDHLDFLPCYSKKPSLQPPVIDLVIPVDDTFESGRLILYCNAENQVFHFPCFATITMQRSNLQNPMHFGIAFVQQQPLGDPENTGVTVISGWNPTADIHQEQDFLFLRAQ